MPKSNETEHKKLSKNIFYLFKRGPGILHKTVSDSFAMATDKVCRLQ